MCLAVTCHLQFGRIPGIFYATMVNRGGTDKKKKKKKSAQYRKLILERKIRPTLLPRLEPETFRLHNSVVCCPPTVPAPCGWVLKKEGRNTGGASVPGKR